MSNILLVTLNAKYIHSSLALRSLRANVGQACEILELTVNNRREDILSQIYRRKPDVLGLSCTIWNTGSLLGVADDLKKLLPGCRIIAGGPEATHDAEAILRGHSVDAVVLGEGELVFARLVEKNFDPRGVPGVAYLENGRVVSASADGGEPCAPELGRLRFAYTDFDGLENKIIYYESARGCPYACAYCMSALTRGVRRLPLETVFRQLDALLAHRPPQVKFADRTFNCDGRYAMAIWRHLIAQDNGVTNFHFEISGGLLDADALALLASARPGLFQFEIGVQTTNPKTLRAINRPNDLPRLSENVRALTKAGNIHLHLDLIAGLPYEDITSFQKSFDYVYGLAPHQLQLGFLKLLKGSPLRSDAGRYDIVFTDHAPYEVLRTAWLSFDELLMLKQVEETLEVYYNSGQFRASVRYLSRFYESLFAFYVALAAVRGDGLESRGKARVARELYDFGLTVGDGAVLRELLRFDLCLNDRPQALPDWLRADVSPEIKKRMGLPKRGDLALERFGYTVVDWLDGGELAKAEVYLLFDYRRRDPVRTGINCRVERIDQNYVYMEKTAEGIQ